MKSRRRTSTELRRLRSLLEVASDSMLVIDQAGVIVLTNTQTEKLFGYHQEEILGRPVEVLIPERFHERHLGRRREYSAEPRVRPMGAKRQLFGLRKDGTEFPVEISLSPIETTDAILVASAIRDITERKLEEESRLRLATIVESSDDAIISKNLDGFIVSWNRGAQRIYGYTEAEAVGRPITILVPLELVDEEHKILERVRAGERIEHYETVRVNAGGKRIDVSLSISPIKNSSGTILGLCSISRNISERKKGEEARSLAEQELRKANERLHLALEAGLAGGWDYDLKTGKDVWFGAAHAQLGITTDETTGSREEFWNRVHDDDRERVAHALKVAKERHEDFGEDVRVVWPDGTIRWLRSRGRFHYAANGDAERSVGISLDITERKRIEEALLRHAAIVESSDDGISSLTLDGITVTWNAGAQRMFGYTENEMIGRPASIIVPPELRDQQKAILETLWAGGRIEQFETVRVSKTGERIDVSLSISPIKDSTGKIVGCAGIARDITKRKRAEEALLNSEQRYRLLFERNVAGVAIGTLDGQVLDCNDGWARILGYESRGELLGRNASEFYFNPHERQPLLDELQKQAVFSRELQLKRKDGSPVWVLFNAAALNGEHGARVLQATMIDISAWKRAESALSEMTRKLIESQEQERCRIGRELHDDINQRLALLAVELEQLRQKPSNVESRAEKLRKQTMEISDDVQALSHQLHSSKLEYLGAVRAIKGWCREFAERQRIEIGVKADVVSSVPFDIGLCLFRVIQEALHNAVKHSGAQRVEVQLSEHPDGIHLKVEDRGKGFDIEAARQGRGLGLTSMEERVRLAGGTIEIQSNPVAGTTIYVRVPLNVEQMAQRAAG